MKLGKQKHKHDDRTVKMATFIDTTLKAPVKFDFDKGRKPFPSRVWGNDVYGDCVFAAQMNQLLRVERLETRHTLPAVEDDVIRRYQVLTGCRAPDDANDVGYNMLDGFNVWRKQGWPIEKQLDKNYTIDAFGTLDQHDRNQMRLGCYLLHGVQFGFALPRSVRGKNVWDVSTGIGSTPGSWGGHAVYGKKYDADGFWVKSWGEDIYVTNAFIDQCCDEAWVVVDSLDKWRKHPAFDVAKLLAYFNQIGVTPH